jgi:hypothetical protein
MHLHSKVFVKNAGGAAIAKPDRSQSDCSKFRHARIN